MAQYYQIVNTTIDDLRRIYPNLDGVQFIMNSDDQSQPQLVQIQQSPSHQAAAEVQAQVQAQQIQQQPSPMFRQVQQPMQIRLATPRMPNASAVIRQQAAPPPQPRPRAQGARAPRAQRPMGAANSQRMPSPGAPIHYQSIQTPIQSPLQRQGAPMHVNYQRQTTPRPPKSTAAENRAAAAATPPTPVAKFNVQIGPGQQTELKPVDAAKVTIRRQMQRSGDPDDLEESIEAAIVSKATSDEQGELPPPPPPPPENDEDTRKLVRLANGQIIPMSEYRAMQRQNQQQRALVRPVPTKKVAPSTPPQTPPRQEDVRERESANMLVILQSGEHRLITFTLPKKSCTVQELLEQVGVPFTADSNIQCISNPGADINYVVTVGMPNAESTELLTAAKNTLKRTQAAQQAAAVQQTTTTTKQQPCKTPFAGDYKTVPTSSQQQQQQKQSGTPGVVKGKASDQLDKAKLELKRQQVAEMVNKGIVGVTVNTEKGRDQSPDTDTIQSLISVLKEHRTVETIEFLNKILENPAKSSNLDSSASSEPTLNDLKTSMTDISSRLTGMERNMSIPVVDEKPIILNDGQAVSKAIFEAVGKHIQMTQPRFDLDSVIPRGTRLMLVVLRGGRHESSKLFLCPSQKKIGDLQYFQVHGEVSPESIHVLTAVPCESIDWICFIDLPGEKQGESKVERSEMLTCGVCKETFSSNDALRVHLEGHASQLFDSDEEPQENEIKTERDFDQESDEESLVFVYGQEDQLQDQQGAHGEEDAEEFTSVAPSEAVEKRRTLPERESSSKTLNCSKCSFKTINKVTFKVHMKQMHLNKIKCDHCPKRYPSKGHLANHIRKEHKEDEDKAILPEDEFFRIKEKRDKQKKRLYECLKCTVKTEYRSQIYVHIRGVHKNLLNERYKSKGMELDDAAKSSELHKCSNYTFKTTYKEALKRHLNVVHLNIRNFTCELCQKQYPMKGELRQHIERHHLKLNRKDILSCNRGSKCTFKTTTKYELSRHIRRVHQKIKGFSCKVCGKWYSTQQSLCLHKQNHSMEGNRLTCDLCQTTTKNKHVMYQHMKRMHLKKESE